MLEQSSNIFDNIDGKFVARLREISSNTRSTADGKATITFKTARIEANYSPDTIKKIEAGRLLAIPNVMGVNSNDNYSIYEVADIYPMHYSMLTLDNKQPGPIRKEFMNLIDKEWQLGSKSTWIEIVAAPTGYIMELSHDKAEPNFLKKNTSALTGSEVNLLSDQTIRKFICYTPKDQKLVENYMIGHLLGATDKQIPFTVNIEKLIHYHVGVFAFTGSGKSNLTSLTIRKAMNTISDIKFVVFDISSEYAINILDLIKARPSRIILTDSLPDYGEKESDYEKIAKDFLVRHVVPEAVMNKNEEIISSVEQIIRDDKIRILSIPSESEQTMQQFSTYGGLMRSLADLTNEKFGAASQKILIPKVVNMIKKFMLEKKFNEDSVMGPEITPLIDSIDEALSRAKLRADAQLLTIFANLRVGMEQPDQTAEASKDNSSEYDTSKLVNEILNTDIDVTQTVCYKPSRCGGCKILLFRSNKSDL